MIKKFILILHGPQCSGKSTIAKLLLEKYPEVFHASFDKIKWLISDYTAEKYSGTGIVNRLVLALVRQAVTQGFSILVEGNNGLMKELGAYQELAKENGLKLIRVNIEAPYDVLFKRFNQRLKDAEIKGNKLSVTTEEGMRERHERYQTQKDSTLPVFDSSTMTPEEILLRLEGLL